MYKYFIATHTILDLKQLNIFVKVPITKIYRIQSHYEKVNSEGHPIDFSAHFPQITSRYVRLSFPSRRNRRDFPTPDL